MAVNPNDDTEFADALRAHGILPPKPKTPPSPSTFLPSAEELKHHVLSAASADALQQLEEDAVSSDEERLLASYRAKKLAEMKKQQAKVRRAGVECGGDGVSIRDIGRDDFVKEVSEASKRELVDEDDEEEYREDREDDGLDEGVSERTKGKNKRGMGVVCFLYKEGIPFSNHLYSLLLTISPHCPLTKFVKIRADQCIENYPDRNVPTLLLYRAGDCVASLTPFDGAMRMGMKMGAQDLERILLQHGILTAPSSSLSAHLRRLAASRNGTASSDEENEDDDEFGTIRRGKAGAERGVRTGGKGLGLGDDDEDSDFDM